MRNQITSRQGFSLFELITAVAASGVLVVGMSSTLFITMRAVDPATTPAADTLTGLNILSEISGELQFTQAVIANNTTSFVVAVPDRDGDTLPESISYFWPVVPGSPLIRQYNSGGVEVVVSDVHKFIIDYHKPASDIEYINVCLQITSDPRTSVETAIPLLNRP